MEFSERIKELYGEIYSGSGGSEKSAVDYFSKWGWYATLDMMADGDIFSMEKLEDMNVHRFHVALAHKLDKRKMEASLRKGNNSSIFFK